MLHKYYRGFLYSRERYAKLYFLVAVLCCSITLLHPINTSAEVYPLKDRAQIPINTQEIPSDALSQTALHKNKATILVLIDNSGSMKDTDPTDMAKIAIKGFASEILYKNLEVDFGIVAFDSKPQAVLPLQPLLKSVIHAMDTPMSAIDYSGSRTDIPAAIESAIYMLKNSNPTSFRNIVLITDGIIDTGNAVNDRRREAWLKETLIPEAQQLDITIFSIALSEGVDFQLMQQLANATQGDYFRTPHVTNLSSAFSSIFEQLLEQEHVKREKEAMKALQDSLVLADNPLPTSLPKTLSEELQNNEPAEAIRPLTPAHNEAWYKTYFYFPIVYLIVIGFTFFIIILLYLGYRRSGGKETSITTQTEAVTSKKAFLIDLDTNDEKEHKIALSIKPLLIGRHPAKNPEIYDSFIIDKPTVGRRHAIITYSEDDYWITDQGSLNKTYINEKVITSKKLLRNGDIIKIYKHRLQFVKIDTQSDDKTALSPTIFSKELGDLLQQGNDGDPIAKVEWGDSQIHDYFQKKSEFISLWGENDDENHKDKSTPSSKQDYPKSKT